MNIVIWDVLVRCFARFSSPDFTSVRHGATSHPPIKVAPTSQGRTHQSRSHPPVKVAPTSQGRVATWRALWQSTVRSACPAVHSTNRNLPYTAADLVLSKETWLTRQAKSLGRRREDLKNIASTSACSFCRTPDPCLSEPASTCRAN